MFMFVPTSAMYIRPPPPLLSFLWDNWAHTYFFRNNFIELKIYYDSLIEAFITESPEFDIYQILSKYKTKQL